MIKKTKTAESFDFLDKTTADITFLSTQMNPVEEAGKMRNVILSDFPGNVSFRPNDNNYLFSQIDSILKNNSSEAIIVGALHGDLVKLYQDGALQPINDIYNNLTDRSFSENLMKLGRLDGENLFYIPWMQATFVMVANKKALPFLPAGAELDNLSYDQLYQWGENIYKSNGKNAIGFPAGSKGLMHRLFQGYLYPSFTGSTLLKFRSPEAVSMWEYFKKLWQYVHPGSLAYSTMTGPLLTEDIWITWEHTARLINAFKERADDFVAFPAPVGPKGRGFMVVISGLSIPDAVTDINNPAILIDYLTLPEIQKRILSETGFFPVIAFTENLSIPQYLQSLSLAVEKQTDSRDSIPALLPVGFGDQGGDYNNLFMLTFSEIVLERKDIQTVLNVNAGELQRIIDEENVKAWLPDISLERPCKIE